MKTSTLSRRPGGVTQHGVTLLEILITMLILAFGLTGLIGMQMKAQGAQAEAYQRAQAILLVQDMANRVSVNRINAASYVTATPLGTGDSQPASCTGLTGALLDQCEWSHAIQGAGEQLSGSSVGAMVNGRGCVAKTGTNPDVYQVTVAWQGTSDLAAPTLTCGSGSYARDTLRRAISATVAVACLTC
jgi:type IV pilus assembly protein PilV